MKPLLYLTIILLFVTGCHRPLGPYRNFDQWLLNVDDDGHRRPLSDHPKEIREYNYMASDTDKPEKRRMRYDRFGFNADGDLSWRKTYLHDTLLTTSTGRYDANGYQSTGSGPEKGPD